MAFLFEKELKSIANAFYIFGLILLLFCIVFESQLL